MTKWKKIVVRLRPLILLALIFVAWEAAVVVLNIPGFKLPRPSSIFSFMVENAQYLLHHTGLTVIEAVLGFLLAVGVSIPIALGIVFSKNLEVTVFPLVVVVNVLPKIALVPVFIVWFGTGMSMKVMIVFLIAFFPLVVNTVLGLRDVDPDLVDIARSMGASTRQIFTKIRIPHSVPYLFTGMRIAIVLSVVGAIIAEFVAGTTGIGWLIIYGKAMFNTPQIFAALFSAAIVGIVLFRIVVLMERKLMPWRIREEATLGTY